MKKEIHLQQMKEYERALRLHWPVSYWITPGADTCRIVCDPIGRRHEVWAHEGIIRSPELMRSDIVHELCHAALAERVDPAFSTIWFSDKWNQISRKEPARFGRLARMLYLAWSHVDIWVNDLRHELWPELTADDCSLFAQGLVIVLRRGEEEIIRRPETALGIAQYQADRERHGLSDLPDLFILLNAGGFPANEQVAALAEFYKSLPRLKFNARKDLKRLKNSVVEAIKLLNFSITPKLVYEEGRWVWDLG